MSLKPEFTFQRKPVYNHDGLVGWAWVAIGPNDIIDFGMVFNTTKGKHAADIAADRANAAIEQYKLAHDLVCA